MPFGKAVRAHLAEFQQRYAEKGVQFLGIAANQQDSLTKIMAYSRLHNIGFPILKDLREQAGRSTREHTGLPRCSFSMNVARIRYHGCIDDQYGIGYVRRSPDQTYLATAIDELLAGKGVAKRKRLLSDVASAVSQLTRSSK